MSSVLVVDDKEMMRDSVAATLQRAGFKVRAACDGQSALAMIAERRPDAVVTDLKMPGLSGIDLLERVRAIDDGLPIVLMTAFGTIETAVRAIKLGAFDYITKPFEGDELIIAVKRAIRHRSVLRENEALKASGATGLTGLDRLIGDSPAMRRVKEQVLAVADSQGTVLLVGESGTGKEVVARAVHELSARKAEPFLAVNCAALSESLLESELFGHEKGAFTGADKTRKGRFELAHTGTLLLDEISEIGPSIQAKLLRVLQERAFERVGSSTPIGVDVRVVATSNRDLPRSVASGDFRQDLFFRLNVLPIHLPPLRDRPEDVPALADHFATGLCHREGREPVRFSHEAMDLMRAYPWPGNVRELQNICERAVVLGRAGHTSTIDRQMIEPWLCGSPAAQLNPGIDAMHFNAARLAGPGDPTPRPGPVSMAPAHPQQVVTMPGGVGRGPADDAEPLEVVVRPLADVERDVIVATLRRFDGHRQKTAEALGIGVRTLGLKLKKWKEQSLVEQTL